MTWQLMWRKASLQVALLSPYVQREVLRSGHGVSEEDPVILPKQVPIHWLAACMQPASHAAAAARV